MKERPILFSGPMVRALIDGRKTQTRRIVKLPHNNRLGVWEPTTIGGPDGGRTASGATVPFQAAVWHTRTGDSLMCPHGQPGDQLWVRESGVKIKLAASDFHIFRHDEPTTLRIGDYWVEETRAPGASYNVAGCSRESALSYREAKVVPSIHMPRWACRLELVIANVRVERVQDINEADAMAEGVESVRNEGEYWKDYLRSTKRCDEMTCLTARDSFRTLWDSINASRGFGWDVNPWIWALSFRRVERPSAAIVVDLCEDDVPF
ncbi:hypothetical protein [Paraburkholderia azotifigens]|uniref:hypothetical protein n=1 Tax=Paraburkholderia azotifigens TaxID=2057004 RepID=UPI003CCC6210